MTEPRRSAPTAVDEYIARAARPARSHLRKLRAAIRSAVPRGTTEVISYRMPAFKRDVVLVWYAAFARHCSLFPGGSVLERFKRQLVGFRTSRGTIRFPLDKPLPVALIKRIVKARVQERDARKRE